MGRLFITGSQKANFVIDGGVALVVGFVVAKYSDANLPVWSVAVIVVVLIGVILAFWIALAASDDQTNRFWREIQNRHMAHHAEVEKQRTAFEQERRELMDAREIRLVKAVVQSFSPYPKCNCILIVSWSKGGVLAVGTNVSVAMQEATHEVPIGSGMVRSIQGNGDGVITLDNVYEGASEYVSRTLKTPELVSKLVIGVQVNLQHLELSRSPVTPADELENVDAVTKRKA